MSGRRSRSHSQAEDEPAEDPFAFPAESPPPQQRAKRASTVLAAAISAASGTPARKSMAPVRSSKKAPASGAASAAASVAADLAAATKIQAMLASGAAPNRTPKKKNNNKPTKPLPFPSAHKPTGAASRKRARTPTTSSSSSEEESADSTSEEDESDDDRRSQKKPGRKPMQPRALLSSIAKKPRTSSGSSGRPAAASGSSSSSARSKPGPASKKTILDPTDPLSPKDDVCCICSDGGVLMVCEGCVHAFHASCLEDHHVDNFETLKELGEEDPLMCADVHMTCTARTTPVTVEDVDRKNTEAIDKAVATTDTRIKWGPKLAQRNGRRYYKSFTRHGDQYAIGSFISLASSEEDGPKRHGKPLDFIAEIESMYEDMATNEKMVECRWLYTPEETRRGRLPHHQDDEVFMTAHMDMNEIDSIQDLCDVVEFDEYQRRKAEVSRQPDSDGTRKVYFVRQTYDDDRGEFRPWIPLKDKIARGTKTALATALLTSPAKQRPAGGPKQSVFAQACAQLQLSAAPPRLPCRDIERQKITRFIESSMVRGHADGGLYIAGVPGTGKCWGWNTRMMMFDGRTKRVQDIQEGDQLMGDDGTPRTVQIGSLTRGHTARDGPEAATYRVTSENKGNDTWTCNADHIMVLKFQSKPTQVRTDRGGGKMKYCYRTLAVDEANVVVEQTIRFPTRAEAECALVKVLVAWQPLVWEGSVADFLRLPKRVRRQATMFQPDQVTFGADKANRLHQHLSQAKGGQVTKEETEWTAWDIGMRLARGREQAKNPLHESILRAYNLADRHTFPHQLLSESIDVRTHLLAGVIDGAGHVDKRRRLIEVRATDREFLSGVIQLARGLGFSTGAVSKKRHAEEQTGQVSDRFRVRISGSDFHQLRTALRRQCIPWPAEDDVASSIDSPRSAGFRLSKVAHAAYYGFTLDGNGRCLLGDLTVTHNTATVIRVISELASRDDIPNFEYVEINGMKLPEPHQLYTVLWEKLTGKRAAPAKAAVFLDQRFRTTNLKRPTCVLLVDELDYIMTRQQNVIYNLFDWPGRRSARLIVVGISNTIDLPDLLMPRVHSRLGLTKLHFEPYSAGQIIEIVQDRLKDMPAFEPDAIELCARKIASVSGDIRRALQICRRAAEICEEDQLRAALAKATSGKRPPSAASASAGAGGAAVSPAGVIGAHHITRAIADLQNSNFIHYLSHSATPHDKLLLSGLLTSIKFAADAGAAGEANPQIPLLTLIEHTESNFDVRGVRSLLAKSQGVRVEDYPANGVQEWHALVQQWSDLKLVQLAYQRGDRWPLVQLNVLTEDIDYAFRSDELWDKLRRSG